MRPPGIHLAGAAALLALSCSAYDAGADGGMVIASGGAGPLRYSLWVSPAPLRAGLSEWSVLLQNPLDGAVVLDAEVELLVRRAQGGADDSAWLAARATRQGSDNRLLYTALLRLPQPGVWQVVVRVRAAQGEGTLEVEVEVAPGVGPLREHWRALALPPLALGLFALHQWLVLLHASRRAGPTALLRQRR